MSWNKNVPNLTSLSLSLWSVFVQQRTCHIYNGSGLITSNICPSPLRCFLTLQRPLVRTTAESLLWSFPQANRDKTGADIISGSGVYSHRSLYRSDVHFSDPVNNTIRFSLLPGAKGIWGRFGDTTYNNRRCFVCTVSESICSRYFTDYMVSGQIKQ